MSTNLDNWYNECYNIDQMKVTRNNHTDIRQTVSVNTRQWVADHGAGIAEKITTFFETQAGSR